MIATPAEIRRYAGRFGFPGGAQHGVAEVPGHVFVDPRWYCPLLNVRPKEGGSAPFVLWSQQMLMAQAYLEAVQAGKWLVLVKPRQLGSSTFFTSVLFWRILWSRGVRACILGFQQKNAKGLSKHVLRYYDNMSPEMRQFAPAKNMRDRTRLELVGSAMQPHDSICSVAGVKDNNPERSETVQFALTTELAIWDDDAAIQAWTAFRSALPRSAMMIAESTPMYVDDPLHKVWAESFEPDSRWHRIFIPWYIVPEYMVQPPAGWRPRSDVRDYWDKYPDLTEAHIFWMQAYGLPNCQSVRGSATIETFMAEYPYDTHECWRAAGEAIFPRKPILDRLRELDGGKWDQQQGTEHWSVRPGEVEPIGITNGHRYLLICDPASSFTERDDFGYMLLDFSTSPFDQVWDRREHTDAMKAARVITTMVDKILEAGGDIRVLVERNTIGEAVILLLIERGYGRYLVYTRSGHDRRDRPKPGFWTSSSNKAEAITIGQQWIEEGSVAIYSVRLLNQLRAYRDQWSKARDPGGGHFDLVVCLVMGCWWIKHNISTQRYRSTGATPKKELTFGKPGELNAEMIKYLTRPGGGNRSTWWGPMK